MVELTVQVYDSPCILYHRMMRRGLETSIEHDTNRQRVYSTTHPPTQSVQVPSITSHCRNYKVTSISWRILLEAE